MKRIHVFVSGIVQGVAFRYFAIRKAKDLGVKGWVKNLLSGKVEIIAEGEDWKLKDFVKEIKMGPPAATVTGVEVKEEEFKNEFDSFEVRF
jgi:acylphosphatase